MRLAGRLLTNSEYSRDELRRNTGFAAEVVYHGIPDPFHGLPTGPRERMALTVANVAPALTRAQGAASLRRGRGAPARRPVRRRGPVARRRGGGAAGARGPERAPHRRAHGRGARQSLRAGFGVRAGVASRGLRDDGRRGDAGRLRPGRDLGGCATRGRRDTGVVVESPDPARRRCRGERGPRLPEDARSRARERVLDRFPLEVRRRGLLRLVDEALAERPAARGPRA